MIKSLTLILFTLVLVFNSEAAVKRVSLSSNLSKHKKEISSISKKIYAIEKNLGNGNKRYLKTLNQRKKIEEVIVTLEEKISSEQNKISKKKEISAKRLNQTLVQAFGSQKEPAELLGLRVVAKMLKAELKSLSTIEKRNLSLAANLEKTRKKYEGLRQVEVDLLSLLREMEESKRTKSLRYIVLNKKKSELQIKLKLNKAKRVTKKKKGKKAAAGPILKERFSRPLQSIVDVEYGKKGVTYKFDKRQVVKNSRAGKVIHTGSLSTYGNVVMVDHGNEVKSIFLGQFLPSVKKGQKIAAGASLGKTFDVAKNEGKLYFEVRKKNKAQNTFQLLDKNMAAKDSRGRQSI